MAEGGVAAGEISGIQAVSVMLPRFMPAAAGREFKRLAQLFCPALPQHECASHDDHEGEYLAKPSNR